MIKINSIYWSISTVNKSEVSFLCVWDWKHVKKKRKNKSLCFQGWCYWSVSITGSADASPSFWGSPGRMSVTFCISSSICSSVSLSSLSSTICKVRSYIGYTYNIQCWPFINSLFSIQSVLLVYYRGTDKS